MLQHAPPVAISTDEAQAVFELWARRRQEADTHQQMPTTRDLAEAMGISEDEVMRMLREVRSTPPVIQPVSPPKAKKRRPWRTFVFLGLAAVCGFAAFQAGVQNGLRRGPFWAPVPYSVAPDAFSFQRQNLPRGLSAEFRGYTLTGSRTTVSDMVALESNLYSGLHGVVADQTPDTTPMFPSAVPDFDKVRKALQTDTLDGVENVLAFEPITLKAGQTATKVLIPIALSSDPQLDTLIRQEVDRRIRVAANKGARIYDANRGTTEASR
ncbi:MAG: hypothetical protein K1X67_19325 [Fimbriimonadaceae bacterium]|nr:hypothetical protein [Fimbriimonadaceae bacterium]